MEIVQNRYIFLVLCRYGSKLVCFLETAKKEQVKQIRFSITVKNSAKTMSRKWVSNNLKKNLKAEKLQSNFPGLQKKSLI